MTTQCRRGQDRSGQTTVWIRSDPRENACHPGFNYRIECAGDEPREVAGASFCPYLGLVTHSPVQ